MSLTSSSSPSLPESTSKKDQEDAKALAIVNSQALIINHALNTRDFDLLFQCLNYDFIGFWAFFPNTPLTRSEFINSIREHAKQNPTWQCKALVMSLQIRARGREARPERIDVMVDAEQGGEPEGIVRRTFFYMKFRRRRDAPQDSDANAEWLCVELRATQGLPAGDVWDD